MTGRLCVFLSLNAAQICLRSCSKRSASSIPLSALARGKCLCGTFSRGVKGAVDGFEYDSRDQSTTEAYGARRITGRGLRARSARATRRFQMGLVNLSVTSTRAGSEVASDPIGDAGSGWYWRVWARGVCVNVFVEPPAVWAVGARGWHAFAAPVCVPHPPWCTG